jgi:protein tyrosine/serine phosphatase
MSHFSTTNNSHDQRRLRWDACVNVRDVGGYTTNDGRQLRWGALLRADNLCRLTPEGHTALLAYGVRTVIDLRFLDEAQEFPYTLQSATIYRNLPLIDATAVEFVDAAENLQELYRRILESSQAHIAAAIQAIADAEPGGVLVHCHAGKDRTGIVVAMLLTLVGVSYDTIVEDYALSEVYLGSELPRILAENSHDATLHARLTWLLRTPPAAMAATLDYLDTAYGGPRAYLTAAGVTEAQIERIVGRLLV